MRIADGFAATWDIYLLIPFLHIETSVLKSINTKNNIIIYTYPFRTFNKNPPKKIDIQYTFFDDT